MKKNIILSVLLVVVTLTSQAKKDTNAWKNEKSLEQQYVVFKENLNFWNGSFFLKEAQLDELYNALTDSISSLESKMSEEAVLVKSLQRELNTANKTLEDTKAELESSIKNQNAIEIFGQNVDKSIYTFVMSMIILGLLVFLVILFLLFKRNSNVTSRTKKEYSELKEEFEIHKKNALERYTKINMELHHTRLKLNRK